MRLPPIFALSLTIDKGLFLIYTYLVHFAGKGGQVGVRTFRQYLTQKKIHSGFYRRRLVLMASILLFAIAVLAIIQWATSFRGDLLWIMMVALGFVLVGVLLLMLPGRPLNAEELAQYKDEKRFLDEDWIEELHRNDPHIIGSPSYRDD